MAGPSSCAELDSSAAMLALRARERRRSLLDERPHALEEVPRAAKGVLKFGLHFQLGVEIPVDELVQSELRAGIGPGGPRREPPHQILRVAQQPLIRMNPVDETPIERLLGGDPLAEERHLERPRLA